MNNHTPENLSSTPIDRDKPGWGLREAAQPKKERPAARLEDLDTWRRTSRNDDTPDLVNLWAMWGML